MLAPTVNTKRFLELTQLVLSFASVCAIVDSSRLQWPARSQPGYYASVPQQHDASGDRRFGDLARIDRKRREAEQQSNRRGFALAGARVAASHTARATPAEPGPPPIPAFAQVVAVLRHPLRS